MMMHLNSHLPTWLARDNLTPEFALLVPAARVTPDVRQNDHRNVIAANGIDWERLLRIAGRHSMRPLLARFLSESCRDAVPPEVLTTLHRVVADNTIRSLRKTGELWEILELFAAEGIFAIPFKGPALAMLLYDDLAWRQFVDLDLLLDRRDIARASELLRARGYRINLDWAGVWLF